MKAFNSEFKKCETQRSHFKNIVIKWALIKAITQS